MAGQGKSNSTTDEGIDFLDAGSHRWTWVTRLQGPQHIPEVVNITHEHQKVHEGEFYSTGYYNSAVADDASIEILLQTPADKELHAYLKIVAGGDCEFEVFEGTTFSAAGTSISPVNHNRNSTNVCGCTVTHTPTITADGDLIWMEYIPGGVFITPGAVQNVGAEQAVFANNANYLLRVTNRSALTNPFQIQAAYYPAQV
jgi:hypothetical protein